MKSHLSAIIIALFLLHTLAPAQQHNPPVGPCCECLKMMINTTSDKPNSPTPTFYINKDGKVKVEVKVTVSSTCDVSPLSWSVIARPLQGNGATVNSQVNGSIAMFDFTKEQVATSSEWQFELRCDKSNSPPDESKKSCKIERFDIKKKPCTSCTGGSICNPSAAQGCFTLTIPTTQSNGGMTEGILYFHTPDFTFPGRAGLTAVMPDDITITRVGGLITQINTGAGVIDVSDGSNPNSINIIHKDAAGDPFRTTVVSLVTEAGVQRMRMDTTFDNNTIRYEQTEPTPGTTVMEKGRVSGGSFEPMFRETLIKDLSSPGVELKRTKIEERANASGTWQTTSDVAESWEKQIYGWVKTKEVVDPDGISLTSKWTYYQPGETTGANASTEGLGRLKSYSRYDGFQSLHTYGHNYQSVSTPYAENITGKVSTITHDPTTNTTTTTITVNGQMISKDVTTKVVNANEHYEVNDVYTSQNAKLTTVTHYKIQGSDFIHKPIRKLHSDGTLTTYSYAREATGGYTTTTENGSTENGTSVKDGMRTITTTNSRGTTILSKTEAVGHGAADGLTYSLMAVTAVDNLGRALTTAFHPDSISINGETITASNPAWTTTTVYTCCGLSSQTDQYGIKTFYAYDGLQRQIKSNTLGVTTETHFNGLTTETHRYAETVSASLSPALQGTSATLVSKSVSNMTGTLQESWSPDPTSATAGALVKASSTVTSFLNPQGPNIPFFLGNGIGQRTVTTTADNFSQTTDSFIDGKTAKTYGDLSPAMQYAYTVNTTGEISSQSYVDGTNLRETTSTQSDWAGRTLSNTYMDNATATMDYNSLGQMVKSTDPDGVVSLMAYNAEGEQVLNALDLNANGVIDYGVDTVSFSDSVPVVDNSSNPIWKSISKVWQPGDNSPTGGTVVSTSVQSVNGLISASQSIGVANPSTNVTTLNGNGAWTTTSTAPDGTKSLSTYTDGKMASMASLASNNSVIESQTQGYDALNRPITSTHSRTGASTTNYLSLTADIVASVSDAAGRTTAFLYDIRGRQITVNAPDTVDANNADLFNITTTTYNPDNTIAETNGDQTYRVSHTYDYADRQISMTTYGTETATTTWQYSQTRGFLLAKRDAANKGATYTYTAAGRLASRTWARGVSTTYSYDNGGRMGSSNYSDTTPDITMAYDALGRQTAQSNGIATSTFAYNSGNLQLDTETITYNLTNQLAFTRVIDRSQDNLGRDSGWTLGAPTPSSAFDNQVEYQYSATDGRLATVRRGDIPVPQEFNYTYTPNSSLIATVTSPVHTVLNSYDGTRDVLFTKTNHTGNPANPLSKFDYSLGSGVNDLGQRTSLATKGSGFDGSSLTDTTATGPAYGWGYNNRGELVSANDTSAANNDRAYAFDGIGNRTSGGDHGSPILYTANALNQYSAIGSINPLYDDDGNLTSGPLPANVNANSTLIWDGENRLIQAQVNGGNTVNYKYDSQSRRIAETVGSATTVYIYDGWNPIAEYSFSLLPAPSSTLTKSYTWGMDLSGSMQGAGGVGGLLMVTVGSTGSVDRYFPTYDGNGNVSEYLDSTGAIAAHYEYDSFGKAIRATGTKAADFVHRFSTKPLDVTTGLYYYGYRFYDPEIGRWPSRDPIEEEGGLNLYGFVWNVPLSWVDVLGLQGEDLNCFYVYIKILIPDDKYNLKRAVPQHASFGRRRSGDTARVRLYGTRQNGRWKEEERYNPNEPDSEKNVTQGGKQGKLYECCCLNDEEFKELESRFENLSKNKIPEGGSKGNPLKRTKNGKYILGNQFGVPYNCGTAVSTIIHSLGGCPTDNIWNMKPEDLAHNDADKFFDPVEELYTQMEDSTKIGKCKVVHNGVPPTNKYR